MITRRNYRLNFIMTLGWARIAARPSDAIISGAEIAVWPVSRMPPEMLGENVG
jgi:hypothetical protein